MCHHLRRLDLRDRPGLLRRLARKTQRYSVNIYRQELEIPLAAGTIETAHENFLILADPQLYSPRLGLLRQDAERIERVLWKIVRGLNFYHHAQVWPKNWKLSWTLSTREDSELPEHFEMFIQIENNEPYGEYQAIFSYRFQHIEGPDVNSFYWALLFWDGIIVTLQFSDPAQPTAN